MVTLPRRAGGIALAAILGIFIALFGQGIWSALVVANLRTSATVPWSVPAMAIVLWLIWRYLDGAWWPRRTSDVRHRLLRARALSMRVFAWSVLAGMSSIGALAGFWIVLAQLTRMPGSVLPDLSQYPKFYVVPLIVTGALVSPILEQAGIWGYSLGMLERDFPAPVAVAISALLFAILPHPPMAAPLLPKLLFFFLTGVTFGTVAYLAGSILPSLVVHAAGLLTFFVLVWPNDPMRPLLAERGPDLWFWLHAGQTIMLGTFAMLAFVRLAKVPRGS